VVVNKTLAMSCELTCSQSSSLIAQKKVEKKKSLIMKIPLPVRAVVVNKPRAMSCELTCSQSSSLIAQNTFEKKKFDYENTTAVTGSGCEQAHDH
jgi:hypothetical protein